MNALLSFRLAEYLVSVKKLLEIWKEIKHIFDFLVKVAGSWKVSSKYSLYMISPQFFLQIYCSQSKLRIWIQMSNSSQSRAPSKNLKKKLEKNQRSVYFHKYFQEKATFKKDTFSFWKKTSLKS